MCYFKRLTPVMENGEMVMARQDRLSGSVFRKCHHSPGTEGMKQNYVKKNAQLYHGEPCISGAMRSMLEPWCYVTYD